MGRRESAQGPRRPGSRPGRRSRRARPQQTLSLSLGDAFGYGGEEAVVTSGYGGEETVVRQWDCVSVHGERVRYSGGEYEEFDDSEEVEAGGSGFCSRLLGSFHRPPSHSFLSS